jgi:hypothetical protein
MSQLSYSRDSEVAKPGLFLPFGSRNIISRPNQTFAFNVWTATVSSDAETSTVLSLPNGQTVTITTAAQGSAALTAAEHITNINADSVAKLWISAANVGADITYTGTIRGAQLAIAGTNIGTPVEAIEPTQGEAIPFGRAVVPNGNGVSLPSTSGSKGSATVTIDTAVDDTAYTVTLNGETITYTSGTGATTSSIRDGLISVINTNINLSGVVQAFVTDIDELTIQTVSLGGVIELTESDANITIDTTNATGVLAEVALGVATRDHGVENRAAFFLNESDEYPATGAVHIAVLDEGNIWMVAKGAVAQGAEARVSTATGFEGLATAELSDSILFQGKSYFASSAADGDLVQVRLK